MKLNLLKKLLTLTPVVISPILVTACGSDKEKIDAVKVTAPGKFYLDFYQKELNAVFATKTAAINAAATNAAANHQYNLKSQVLTEVLASAKKDGASEFKKEFPKLDNYNASIFDDINVSFSIPDDSKGNLKVTENILSIYPTSVISSQSKEKQINYTLTLNKSSKITAKDLSGSLKFNLQAGFVNYSSTSPGSSLSSNSAYTVYGSTDMSTILVGAYQEGLDVGTKKSSGGYDFTKYSTSSSGSKLKNNDVYSVFGNADLSTILVGEYGGGLDVGKRAKASDPYTFTNYSTGSAAGKNLNNDNVESVYGTADLSTILVGERGGGLDVGTKQADNSYKFDNYNTSSSSKLNSNQVHGVSGNKDLSTILIATAGGGLDVGTRTKASDSYTFKNYNTSSGSGLTSDSVYGVYGNNDLATILLSERSKGLDVGVKQNDNSYKFTNYNASKGLASNYVSSAFGNADMSEILVGEYGGLSVGVKQNDGSYTFDSYNTSKGLASNDIFAVSGNADLSTILIGGYRGGLDISSNLWFA